MMFGRKDNRETQFATCKDFQKIFTDEMGSLHLLALLLTANEHKAQQSFVAGLEDSIQGNPVFQQWARSWSKRAVIKNAIKEVAPVAGRPDGVTLQERARAAALNVSLLETHDAQKDACLAAVLELEAFPRFVFVMTILEHFSDRECATLLGATMQDIADAKLQAVEQLAGRALEDEAAVASAVAAASNSAIGSGSVATATAVAAVAPALVQTSAAQASGPANRIRFRLPCGHRMASDVA
jgi:hypothetical protein